MLRNLKRLDDDLSQGGTVERGHVCCRDNWAGSRGYSGRFLMIVVDGGMVGGSIRSMLEFGG